MTKERKIYAPGVYDISNEEYHSCAGISRSGIMEFRKSPMHHWHRYHSGKHIQNEKSFELSFGNAVHTYILERKKFENEYFVAEKNPYHGASTKGKEFKADMLIKCANKIIIEEEDFEVIKAMYNSLSLNPQAIELITDAQYEKSIFWIDPTTQLLCKCRPDIWHKNFVVDLKTTKNASYKSFQRDFYNYGYHLQIAMIYEGIKHTQNDLVSNFIDLAVEKVEPYCHAIYPIDETALQHGIDEFKLYLSEIKFCMDNNNWPSYKTQNLTLPPYANTIGE